MQCKCGNTVEPAYEHIGKCENCHALIGSGIDPCENPYKEKDPNLVKMTREQVALKVSVLDLGLNVRAANALHNAGITHVKDLVEKTKEQLRMKHVGTVTLNNIEDALAGFGLRLKQPPSKTPPENPLLFPNLATLAEEIFCERI